jgi:hypothetical protein
MVLEDGAVEYGKDNWKYVPNADDRYFDAAMRHMCDWKMGITHDQKSKKRHLAHAACCLLFLMWHTVVGEQKENA